MIDYLEKNKRFAMIFVILIAAEIFFVSSIPGSKIVTAGVDASMIYHLLVFFLLNFFIILSVTKKKNKKIRTLIFSVIVSKREPPSGVYTLAVPD